jgi:hypothetical protein
MCKGEAMVVIRHIMRRNAESGKGGQTNLTI